MKTFRHALVSAVVMLALACAAPHASVAVRGARASASATTAASAETREGRLKIFDEVWETVRARYYDPALGGVDWERAREELRGPAAEARGATEFYAVLRLMLARLRDPHTRVYAPGESDDWRVARHVSVGLAARELEGELLITRVERDTEAARAGLRAGDRVLSVDGEPAASLLKRLASESRAAASRVFDGAAGTDAVLRVVREGRAPRTVALRREWRTRAPVFDARREGAWGVVSFNLFTPETAAQLARALKGELSGARGLVIDLRENGGGDSEAMTDAASLFLEPGRSLGRFTGRGGRAHVEPHTRAALLSSPLPAPVYTRAPVVVLTAARTSSAAEVFAAALRESGRATVVGETTCGCVLGIRRRHRLPDGGILDVSETDYHTASGARLERNGLAPDITVPLDARDLRSGRDSAMTRAMELLKSGRR